MMLTARNITLYKRIIFIYFICLLALAPTGLLMFDSYYYWDWSRHLAISYYDGPPMIAYWIRLSTFLFGDTIFALNMVGIIAVACTSGILYKTARLFLCQNASFISVAFWLFSPLVTQDLLKQVTYDTPLMLFWALSLYHVVKYVRYARIKSLYWIGFSLGCLLLSKYSGIVLIMSLLIFLVSTRYRNVFKIPAFYAAIGLAALLFSPVIFWNYICES